ncbi:MAG: nitroreductase family protein [Deltaproteobacteria bacterium]|nr:nitroreductase family protein [Deltaproteobacteria bacterium]MBW2564645.1 nitroreductase family protein [Deltaproteobacteria bacterium]
MDRTVTTTIDAEVCISCGECVRVCPQDTISMQNKKACITGDNSLTCDHCRAACVSGAVTVGGIDESLSRFESFQAERKWLPHGKYDIVGLVNLMQSRRSCRNYLEKPVEKTLLDDLVKIGITAPSGSNCQMWSFNVLPDRSSVEAFARRVKRFYENLNQMAEKSWLRFLLKLIRKPELDSYYENYYESVKEGLADWDEKGKDLLFHGAPAVIIVASKEEASCPSEDALLATQNILLGAHSLGLGTCLVGFVVSAMNRDRKICDVIKLPKDESVYAVIAVGYPDEKYQYVTGKKPALIRTITLSP